MTTATAENQNTNQDGSGQNDEPEFGSAFAEAAGGNDQADTGKVDDQLPADQGQTDEGASGGEGNSGTDQGAQTGQEDGPSPAAPKGDDWLAKLPEEARAAHEAALNAERHKWQSQQGRLSAQDRELARLRALAEGNGGQQDQGRKPLKELLASDEIKAAREEFGEVLGPVLDTLSQIAERVDETAGAVASSRQEATSDAEEQKLTQKVGNWAELAADERFTGWLEAQPRHIREATARNWDAIVDHEEAADVFTRFAGHIAPPQQQQDQGGSSGPSRRERQASAAKDAGGSTGPTVASGEPDDFGTVFELARRKAETSKR